MCEFDEGFDIGGFDSADTFDVGESFDAGLDFDDGLGDISAESVPDIESDAGADSLFDMEENVDIDSTETEMPSLETDTFDLDDSDESSDIDADLLADNNEDIDGLYASTQEDAALSDTEESLDVVNSMGEEVKLPLSEEGLRDAYASAETEADKEQIRAIHELKTLKESYDFSEGDPEVEQLGGRYNDIKGDGGEAHHMPPKSVVEIDAKESPSVKLEHDDHAETPSFGNSTASREYRETVADELNQGNYVDVVKNEVLDVRKNAYDASDESQYDKYDGGLKQTVEYGMEYVGKHGVPKGKE